MTSFFNRERFGKPQFLAGALLLVFLMQCLWLTRVHLRSTLPASGDGLRIQAGLDQFAGKQVAGVPDGGETDGGKPDPDHSPLWYIISAAPRYVSHAPADNANFSYAGWLDRVPYFIAGLLLGASLWYVARRLYSNAGGYLALFLYCFSPAMIRTSALAGSQPELHAAWGAYGAIFTAIAVAHTLYAPREVVLWNWRRITLLGLSLAMAIGTQFSLAVLVVFTLAFLLYLAPERRGAAMVIWAAACTVALVLLSSAYFFHFSALWRSLHHARFIDFSTGAFAFSGSYYRLAQALHGASPTLAFLLPAAIMVWIFWRRARYFGNTSALLMAVACLVLGLAAPHYSGQGFLLVAVPFLFTFVAGVFADLIDTRHGRHIRAALYGLLGSFAAWNLFTLARL